MRATTWEGAMGSATRRESRPDHASIVLIGLAGVIAVCVLAVLLVWPFACIFVAVGPEAAYLFAAGCVGALAFVTWWFVRRSRR